MEEEQQYHRSQLSKVAAIKLTESILMILITELKTCYSICATFVTEFNKTDFRTHPF
jgi:hypothetical protein